MRIALAGVLFAACTAWGAPAQPSKVSTAPAAATTATSQSVPLTGVPWGKAFADYIRLLHDPKTPQDAIEKARQQLERGLESTAGTTATTR